MAINSGIQEWLFNYIKDSVAETPYYNLLGIELMEIGPGEAHLRVIPTKQHTNPLGIVHGGLLMSLADAAMGNAVRSLGVKGVTVNMSNSFLSSPSIGSEITATGKVIKSGRNLLFAEAEIISDNKVLFRSQGTFFNTGQLSKN